MIDITQLSRKYEVRALCYSDMAVILDLYKENRLFYQYTKAQPSKKQVADDMHITPPGMNLLSKYYVGFFRDKELVAAMDLIDGYPEPETAYIGLFMMSMRWQGQKIGSTIIGEVENYLKTIGIKSVRLAINKGNPQSTHFWKKNGYIIIREVEKEDWGTLLEAEKIL